MPFKGISYLELWKSFCSAERYYLCNFDRGYHEEQFRVIILNLGQCFRRRCSLKFFIWGSGGPPVRCKGTIYASFKEGIMRNIPVKLYEVRTSVSGGNVV